MSSQDLKDCDKNSEEENECTTNTQSKEIDEISAADPDYEPSVGRNVRLSSNVEEKNLEKLKILFMR